jgi:MFS family permease
MHTDMVHCYWLNKTQKMIRKLAHRLLEPRHFWRTIGADELVELYISNMLRSLSISLLMVFVPFYLYQHDYSIPAIFCMYGVFFATKIVCDVLAGFMVARFGPKHTMILSCCLQIASAALFLSVPNFHWAVWVLGIPWGASASFFFIAYHVAFSKIKHTAHSGKEIGYMTIMERIGTIIGPVTGGIVGTLFGSQFIFMVATAALFASLWPLFQSKEPVIAHQKLNFRDFPLHKVKHDLIAYAGVGVENTLCINLWPLYVSLFALTGGVYAKLGALSSAAVVASIGSAYVVGRLIDVKNARLTLQVAAILNAAVYFVRPFVTSLVPAFIVNLANESITTGYRMPFFKGVYAAADDLPGFRIVYIVSLEAMSSIAKCTAWFMLALGAQIMSVRTILIVGFMVAAIASIALMTEKFKALNPQKVY